MKFLNAKNRKRDVAFAIMNRLQVINFMPFSRNCL